MTENLESLSFMVVNIGYAKITHPWGYNDLSSPFIRIFYVVEGSATLHLPTGDVDLTPGHMYMVPTFVPHSYACRPGCSFYYLFIIEMEHGESHFFELRHFPVTVNANEGADLLFRHYCRLYPQLSLPYSDAQAFDQHQSYRNYAQSFNKMDDYEHMQLKGLVMILLSYFMKHSQPKSEAQDQRLLRAVQYVQQHISEPPDIDRLANLVCVTRSQLTRIFHRTFDIPPLQYVLRKKIQHAQAQLLTTGMSVQQIAHEVGFDDASYFIRLFRKTIGFTPQEYRLRFK